MTFSRDVQSPVALSTSPELRRLGEMVRALYRTTATEDHEHEDALGLFNVVDQGAVAGGSAPANTTAIQAAIVAAERAGGGVVVFPGGPGTLYPINKRLAITASNVKLWAPGGAKLFLAGGFESPNSTVVLTIGNVDTQVITTESNTLASNAAAGDLSVTLAAGKGANFTAGEFALLLSDTIIPGHDAAVLVTTCEIINVYSISTDTLSLNRPLRYPYTTAAAARIYRVNWLTGIEIDGLGVDGNNQTPCAVTILASCCLKPRFTNLHIENVQQRGIRMSYCLEAVIDNYFQSNGRSALFQGAAVTLNAYAISEGGACEGLRVTNAQIDRCRHGYTTSGVLSNMGVGSPLNTPGFGVPSLSVITGNHHGAKGAGWDTHETGYRITFLDCQTLGSLGVGFQDRAVETRFINCFASDCIGAAIQFGSDSQKPELINFRYERTNLGTDEAGGTDWTQLSPVQSNAVKPSYGAVFPNQIDNGGFELWERGSVFTGICGTANRWKLTSGTGEGITVRQRVHADTRPENGKYYLRFARETAGSSTSTLSQYIDDCRSFSDKRVTLSFVARDSLDNSYVQWRLRQSFGSGASGASADVLTALQTRRIDGSFRPYNINFDVPTVVGKNIGTDENSSLQVEMSIPTGIVDIDIDNVKLEVSPVVTNYLPRSYAEEAEACGRWYEKSYNDGQNPGSASAGGNIRFAGSVADSNLYGANGFFRTRKQRMPTMIIYAPGSGNINRLRNLTTGADLATAPATIPGHQSFHVRIGASGDVTALDVVGLSWIASVPDFE